MELVIDDPAAAKLTWGSMEGQPAGRAAEGPGAVLLLGYTEDAAAQAGPVVVRECAAPRQWRCGPEANRSFKQAFPPLRMRFSAGRDNLVSDRPDMTALRGDALLGEGPKARVGGAHREAALRSGPGVAGARRRGWRTS